MKDTVKSLRFLVRLALVICLAVAVTPGQGKKPPLPAELWRQVEVIRTTFGVPHIRAGNLRAAGYALAWLQCEDYGTETPMNLLDASGRASTVFGYERIEMDLTVLRYRGKIRENYQRLAQQTQDMYDGFAAGVNRYIELIYYKWIFYPMEVTGSATPWRLAARVFRISRLATVG